MALACLGAAPALATGCSDDNPYARNSEIVGPVAHTNSTLLYHDVSLDELIIVEPSEESVEVERISLGDDRDKILWMRSSLDGQGILVLTGPASAKEEHVDEVLHRIAADGSGKIVEYEVEAPFDSVAFSPDHRHAILYFAENADTQLHNANQVAIVNLENKGVRSLTLNGFGSRLSSVHFPSQIVEGEEAPVLIGGHTRDLAAFLAQDEVVLVDMDHEATDQVAVHFDDNIGFAPVATLLRPGNDLFPDPTLFLRSDFHHDVAMLPLIDKDDEVTGEPGFTAQINLVPLGGASSDMRLFDGEDNAYVVSVVDDALVFSDLETQASFDVDLEGHANHLMMRRHDTGDGVVDQAVAWAEGATELHTLALDGIQSSLGRTPRHLKIETGIEQLVSLDNDRALIGSGKTLYVVDFQAEQVTPLTARSFYDPASSALDGDLLLLGTTGEEWISNVDLIALNPESMLLDDPIASFHYLADTGQVAVSHADPSGHLTLVDAAAPSRQTSSVVWGFLYEGVYDREGK
jgi:hypothetical protein